VKRAAVCVQEALYTYQRTAKMLNGSVIMRLEDVAAATLYLGVNPLLK
jgi:hypothetical protein